ncbi:MaoC family dehydratase [Halobaculum gomorrense]|uniref:3-hydroxybutyryl-CoA dehydratase n=1 Tax=Halobaculum gomorrense TaxID=43928 RepID=A0A1M5PKG9_9EURY|nr:MaoC family dehydratase [Halobaculum gomorrense]SHH02284.1 3-hydroxybutyryl-CoA dehydratase [Halobaculum gomorrense]
MSVAAVGDDATASIDVTTETIDQYAALTGDENPIHLDETYASETMFGGRIAHGMLGAGVVSAALAALPGDIVYLDQDCSFEAPVCPGDTVEARATVTESLGGDRLRVETVASVGDETVIEGTATILSLPHES